MSRRIIHHSLTTSNLFWPWLFPLLCILFPLWSMKHADFAAFARVVCYTVENPTCIAPASARHSTHLITKNAMQSTAATAVAWRMRRVAVLARDRTPVLLMLLRLLMLMRLLLLLLVLLLLLLS